MAADTAQSPVTTAVDPGALHVRLDAPLPTEVAVGAGTAVFVCGSCFAAGGRISALWLLVDGAPQPVLAHGMPRLDLFRTLHPGLDPYETAEVTLDPASDEDPLLTSYASGFWALARVGPRAPGATVSLAVRAELDGGGLLEAPLGSLPVVALPEPLPAPATAPGAAVAVCMATFEPPPELFRRQIASLRAQTRTDWVCVISDDCSAPAAFAAIEAEVAGDPRFLVSRSPRRLGFYRNFERALALAPPGAGSSRSPTRTTTGTRTSSRRCSARSATPAWSTATRAWSARTARSARPPTGPGGATTTRTSCRCSSPTR